MMMVLGPQHLMIVITDFSRQIQYFEVETKLSFKSNFQLFIKFEAIFIVSSDILNDYPETPEIPTKRYSSP